MQEKKRSRRWSKTRIKVCYGPLRGSGPGAVVMECYSMWWCRFVEGNPPLMRRSLHWTPFIACGDWEYVSAFCLLCVKPYKFNHPICPSVLNAPLCMCQYLGVVSSSEECSYTYSVCVVKPIEWYNDSTLSLNYMAGLSTYLYQSFVLVFVHLQACHLKISI